MARARNIKPGFFANDELAECEPLARILFIGLWCFADRAGRIENKPKKIKAGILPYDNCDIEALLVQLENTRFITRYVVDNSSYIQIINFTKHQNPHIKEPESTIPAPDEHQTTTVPARLIPDSLNLIPDSLNLIPDSREKNIAPKSATRFTPPSQEDVKNYCEERQRGVDYEKWFNFYSAKGWKVGKNKMVDWRAAVRTWEEKKPEAQVRQEDRKCVGCQYLPMCDGKTGGSRACANYS